ncbi:alpha/beta fold hydrolase [Leifsonia poae]|uniref:alpha/beta fold hydrolase n=1 Tax=Leifsonia poae TaxID=110933 RepID=UPI003D67A50F
MSHRYFSKLCRVLSVRGHVVAFDLPGFGGTAKPGTRLSVERYAHVIGRALDALGIGDCVVVGQSMGAQFAVELARMRPDIVSRVVVIGPVVERARRTVVQQSAALARDTLAEPPSVNAIVFTDYLRCGPRWYLKELRPMLGYAIEERVDDLAQPFLVLRGDKDPISSEGWCRELADRAPLSSFAAVPGHHLVQQTAPDRVAHVIEMFLSAALPAAPAALPR